MVVRPHRDVPGVVAKYGEIHFPRFRRGRLPIWTGLWRDRPRLLPAANCRHAEEQETDRGERAPHESAATFVDSARREREPASIVRPMGPTGTHCLNSFMAQRRPFRRLAHSGGWTVPPPSDSVDPADYPGDGVCKRGLLGEFEKLCRPGKPILPRGVCWRMGP